MRDARGASLFIALLYFLVCAVVGGVVLTAATVTSGQLAAFEKSQQAYYATASAAELFRDAVANGTCISDGSGADAVWTCTLPVQEAGTSTARSTGSETTLAGWLARSTAAVAAGNAAQPVLDKVTVQLSGSQADATKVTAKVTMKTDYSLHIALAPANYDGQAGAYQVVCDIPAALLYREGGLSVERITWGHAIIAKPSSASGGA